MNEQVELKKGILSMVNNFWGVVNFYVRKAQNSNHVPLLFFIINKVNETRSTRIIQATTVAIIIHFLGEPSFFIKRAGIQENSLIRD